MHVALKQDCIMHDFAGGIRFRSELAFPITVFLKSGDSLGLFWVATNRGISFR